MSERGTWPPDNLPDPQDAPDRKGQYECAWCGGDFDSDHPITIDIPCEGGVHVCRYCSAGCLGELLRGSATRTLSHGGDPGPAIAMLFAAEAEAEKKYKARQAAKLAAERGERGKA